MTCFSLPAFYLIVNLVFDLILIQNRDQNQACAPRLAIISHQNSALLHFCTPPPLPPPFFIDDSGAEFHAD